jgi:hypothetical protein
MALGTVIAFAGAAEDNRPGIRRGRRADSGSFGRAL